MRRQRAPTRTGTSGRSSSTSPTRRILSTWGGRTHRRATAAVGQRRQHRIHEIVQPVPTLYDISDPTSPVKLSDFVIDGFENDTVHDPRLQGQIAAFSWYSFGVQIADISRPAAPTLLASFVPEHDIVNPDFFCTTPCSEVWGAYIHRDYILASDMNSGLWVLCSNETSEARRSVPPAPRWLGRPALQSPEDVGDALGPVAEALDDRRARDPVRTLDATGDACAEPAAPTDVALPTVDTVEACAGSWRAGRSRAGWDWLSSAFE